MKTLKNIGLILLVIIILLAIKFIFFPGKKPVAPDMKKMAAAPVSVDIFIASEELVSEKLSVTGNVMANEEVELRPETSGRVIRISFKEGQPVKEGQELVKINDADHRAQLAKVSAQLRLAEENEKRYKQLLDISGVSREEYESVLNQANMLRADLSIVNEQIRKTSILAPFSGTVGLKSISVGDVVSPTTIIARLTQLDPVKIEFAIPERFSADVRNTKSVKFITDNSRDSLAADIFAVEPRVDAASRTVLVRDLAPNKENTILPGGFARIYFSLPGQKGILIPSEAIIPEQKGKKVFIVKNKKAKPVMVETGLRTEKMVQVLSGISSGDSVITTGIMQVRPQSNVKITKVQRASK